MKQFFSFVIATSLLLIIYPASPPVAAALKPDQDQERLNKTLQKRWDKLHPNAKRGASPEAKAAWDSLKPEQQEAVKRIVHRIIAKEKGKFEQSRKEQQASLKSWNDVIAKEKKDGNNGEAATLTYVDAKGNRRSINAKKRDGSLKPSNSLSSKSAQGRAMHPTKSAVGMVKASAPKSSPDWSVAWLSAPSKVAFKPASLLKKSAVVSPDDVDADGDGVPESFENALADAFTPTYHVSQGETDNFSTFEDFVPQTVKGRFGQTPISHFRVVPLGIKLNGLTQRNESFFRIDYLTLWDHDSGLVGYCDYIPPLFAFDGIFGHELDNERSALLVSAPVPDRSINLDPNAYSALSLYTAAHEDTFADNSAYYDFFDSPKPVGTHTDLWLSLSKHSTYPFDPDGEPLLPDALIYGVFAGLGAGAILSFGDNVYDSCDPFEDSTCTPDFEMFATLGDVGAAAGEFYAVTFFYGCAVERFIEPGIVTTANVRINIGEPGLDGSGRQPINGSHFIQDDSARALKLYSKLVTPLRFESSIP